MTESFPGDRRQRIALRIAGGYHRARVAEWREYADGRVSVHLILWPALSDGRRRAWFWSDLAAIEIRSSLTAASTVEMNAVDVRVLPGDVPPEEPAPRYEGFSPGQQVLMRWPWR